MAGFGHSPFGKGPFGRSDLGQDLVINPFPDEYFDDSIKLDADESIKDNDKDPLLKYLKTISALVNNRRKDVDDIQDLLDYEKAPLEIVREWGDMLGLGIDKNDPEFLQRTFLGNASQWLQIKGSRQGYRIRGLASGFEVSVENFWRVDPIYESLFPFRNRFYLKPKNSDDSAQPIFHTDSPPGTHAGTPTEEGEDYAKSSYLRIVFEVAEPRKDFVDYNALLDLVIDKIKDVVAIHHEVQAPQFLMRMNADVDLSIDMLIHELSYVNASECYRFDLTPADEVELDICFPHVTILPNVQFDWDIDVGPSLSISIDEDISSIVLDAAAQALLQIEETVHAEAYQFEVFDGTPADVHDLDINNNVVITVS